MHAPHSHSYLIDGRIFFRPLSAPRLPSSRFPSYLVIRYLPVDYWRRRHCRRRRPFRSDFSPDQSTRGSRASGRANQRHRRRPFAIGPRRRVVTRPRQPSLSVSPRLASLPPTPDQYRAARTITHTAHSRVKQRTDGKDRSWSRAKRGPPRSTPGNKSGQNIGRRFAARLSLWIAGLREQARDETAARTTKERDARVLRD